MANERPGIECPTCGHGTMHVQNHREDFFRVRRRICRNTACNHVIYTIESRIDQNSMHCSRCDTTMGYRVISTMNFQTHMIRTCECNTCETQFQTKERILEEPERTQILKNIRFNQIGIFK